MNHFKLLFVIGFMFVLGFVSLAQQNQNTPTPQLPNVCDKSYFGDGSTGVCNGVNQGNGTLAEQIRSIVTSLNGALIILAPSVAVIAILYGAFKIITNGFKAGIVIIQWALIGVVVVLLANGLLSILISILWN